MQDALFTDAPESDREEIARYTESHGGTIVLRVGGKIGSDAKAEMLRFRKEHGYLPQHDFVWIEAPSLGRQGRQPAPVRFWRWLTRRPTPAAVAPDEREWLDDDDPLARVINDAWERGGSSYWTEGDPLPEKVENPKKVERG